MIAHRKKVNYDNQSYICTEQMAISNVVVAEMTFTTTVRTPARVTQNGWGNDVHNTFPFTYFTNGTQLGRVSSKWSQETRLTHKYTSQKSLYRGAKSNFNIEAEFETLHNDKHVFYVAVFTHYDLKSIHNIWSIVNAETSATRVRRLVVCVFWVGDFNVSLMPEASSGGLDSYRCSSVHNSSIPQPVSQPKRMTRSPTKTQLFALLIL